jgi:hypothetical protein
MRKIFFLLMTGICLHGQAQKNTASNIIEGGRVVVDLLRVIKSPKNSLAHSSSTLQPAAIPADSCATKALGNICYKNTSGKSLYIALYKRNGNTYAAVPLSLTMLNNSKECLYEIQAGIYKYKIEYENDDEKRVVLREGEMKIAACDEKQEDVK